MLEGETAQAKIRSLLESLRNKGLGQYSLFNTYRGGHAILRPNRTDQPNIYVLFKRDFYRTFKHEFSSFMSINPIFAEQEGESINLRALERAINMNCTYVLFIHPNEVFYHFPDVLKDFCERNKLIRGQRRLNYYMKRDCSKKYDPESEVTYSFPKGLLFKLKDLEAII